MSEDDDSKPPRRAAPGRKGAATGNKPFAKRREDGGGHKPRGDFGKGKAWTKREAGSSSAKRPFAKRDGERKPFAKSEGDRKPFAKRDGERKPYGDRAEGKSFEGRADRKPFAKSEGDRKPFAKADGDRKPFAKRDGERKPYGDRAERKSFEGRTDRKPFRANDDRKPFAKADGDRKPFVKRDGERKPYGDRAEGKSFEGRADRKPFRANDDRKPFAKADGDRKPFVKRDGERKPYGDRAEGKSFGQRPPRQASDKEGGRGTFRDDGQGRPFKRADRRDGDRPARTSAAVEDAAGERIAKRLARAGIASRRDAEELIAAGRVKVNGKVLSSPAVNVLANDVIHLDGTEIPPVERTRLFLFHKPPGVVTTNRDPEGRKTVFDVLPADLPRLMTIGRLDINTEGLLLLTNDGGLSRVLELPATGWLRRYRARVHGRVDEKALAGLKDGIAVDGVFYGAIEASLERTQGTNAWLTIGLREGKNREVKNILGALGLEVTRLIRISYGPFQLGELPEGHVLEIKGRMLRDQLGERLVEESGANFDADIVKPFSNKPVRRTERADDAPRMSSARPAARAPIGEGGLIKARKRREGGREEALGKLSTRPERTPFDKRGAGERPGGKAVGGFEGKPGRRGEREQRPIDPPGQRRANVWMAPGARPQGEKRDDAAKSSSDRPSRDRPGGGRPRKPPKAPK